MQYIMTAVWAVLISLAVSYVLTAMGGEPLIITEMLLLAALFVLAIITVDVILKEESE